jgi:hypothetical protein
VPSGTRRSSQRRSASPACRTAARDGRAEPAAAVDREPVAARPPRRRTRLVAREGEDAAAVGAGSKVGQLVGDGEAAGRSGRAGAPIATATRRRISPPAPEPELRPREVDVERDPHPAQRQHLRITNPCTSFGAAARSPRASGPGRRTTAKVVGDPNFVVRRATAEHALASPGRRAARPSLHADFRDDAPLPIQRTGVRRCPQGRRRLRTPRTRRRRQRGRRRCGA